MTIKVYSIKDTKTAFMSPIFSHSDETAIRDLKFTINQDINRQSFIARNYPDLELWQIGTFDDVTGQLTSDVRFVVQLSDLKEVSSNV